MFLCLDFAAMKHGIHINSGKKKIELLGSPIGDPAFCKAHIDDFVAKRVDHSLAALKNPMTLKSSIASSACVSPSAGWSTCSALSPHLSAVRLSRCLTPASGSLFLSALGCYSLPRRGNRSRCLPRGAAPDSGLPPPTPPVPT